MFMSNQRKRSRIIIGFHRLGLVLAVPLLVGAFGTAISAWFSNEGPFVPDPRATPPEQVVLRAQTGDINKMSDDEQRVEANRKLILETKATPIVKVRVDTGAERLFLLYWDSIGTIQHEPIIKDGLANIVIESVIDSITQFERRRGAILLASEQPVLVGDILAQANETDRKFSYLRWTHLTSGFDWQRLALAGSIAAFAAFIYIVVRAISWVIDGFMPRPE